MEKFSDKFGYSKPNQEPIVEDAPIWLRSLFLENILSDYFREEIFADFEGYYDLGSIHLSNFKSFIRSLSIEFHQDYKKMILSYYLSGDQYDLSLWKEYVDFILRNLEWNQFYDFVELLGKKYINLISAHSSELDWNTDEDGTIQEVIEDEIYKIKHYIKCVNDLFEKVNVRWRLDEYSEFQLLFPDELKNRRDRVISQLTDANLETTLTQLKKAEQFITRQPLDPPNSIKEVASVLEALGNELFPSNEKRELTRIVTEMEKTGRYPAHLLKIIRVFYDFACSEPGVRHGIEQPIRIQLADAEFCYHLGIAIAEYLLSMKNTIAK